MMRVAGPTGSGSSNDEDEAQSGGQSDSQSREVGELSNDRQTVAERRRETRDASGSGGERPGGPAPAPGTSPSDDDDSSSNGSSSGSQDDQSGQNSDSTSSESSSSGGSRSSGGGSGGSQDVARGRQRARDRMQDVEESTNTNGGGSESGSSTQDDSYSGGRVRRTNFGEAESSTESGPNGGSDPSQQGGGASQDSNQGRESVRVDASTKSEARAQVTQSTDLSASEITISQADGEGFRVEYPDARSRAAGQIDEDVPTSVSRSDVEPTEDGGYQLTPDAQKSLATQQIDEEITGVDINRVDVERTEDGSFTLSEHAQNRVGVDRAADEYGVSRDELGVDDGSIVPESEDAARAFAEQQAENQVGGGGEVEVTEVAPGVYRGTVTETEGDIQPSGDLDRLTATVATPEGEEYLEEANRRTDVESAIREDAQAETQDRRSAAMGRIIEKQGGDLERAEAQTGRDLDQDNDVTTPEEYVAQQVDEEFDTLERGRDYRVVEQDDRVTVEYTGRGVTAVEAELEGQTGRNVDVQRRQDGPGIDVVVGDRQEQFGDGQLRIGGTSLEEQLEGASDVIQSTADDVAGAVEGGFDLGATAIQGAAPGDTRYQRSAGSAIQTAGDLAGGGVRGVGTIADLPGLALAFKEAGETTGYVVKESFEGTEPVEGVSAGGTPRFDIGEIQQVGRNAGDVVGELGGAGQAAVGRAGEYASENPAETTGMVVGSVAAGYGATRAASRVGAGRATAFAIDPAEEIGGTVLTRGLQRTSRGSRVVDELGGRVDVESTARYVGRGASQRAQRAVDAATQSYRRFSQDTRAQADFSTDGGRLIGQQETDVSTPEGEVDAGTEAITAEDLDVASDGPSQGVDRPAGRPQEAPDRSAYERRRSSRQQQTQEDLTPYADDAAMRATRGRQYEWQSDNIRAEAQSRSVRADSALDTRFSGLGRLGAVSTDARARLEAAQMTDARMDLDQRTAVDLDGRERYQFDARTDFEADTRVDTTTQVDVGTDTRVDTDIQAETRMQVGTQQRVRSRTAARMETRTDGRRRSEWEWDNDPSYSEDEQMAAWDFDQDTWDVGIEDVGDVVFDDGGDW